jgi:energy-coupling factor transporter ATP-binding protein EcfA2
MRPGPETMRQLNRLRSTWEQGEHVVISGATKSGKTALARHIVQLRYDNGGSVVVFVAKPNRDETITEDYLNNGFTRWKSFKKPSSWERRVLLWPDTSKLRTDAEKLKLQKEIFLDAFDKINDKGKWTLQIDEGLYTCDPTFLNMSSNLAMSHAIGRSNFLSVVTLMQRPANVPLIIYGSASHAFVGRTREETDRKRLAELGARESSRELQAMIGRNARHDFTWIPVAPDWPAETINLAH